MMGWECVIGSKMKGAVWGASFLNSALEVKVAGAWVGVRRPIFVIFSENLHISPKFNSNVSTRGLS
ncbi:hypothetical protein ACTQ5J_06250 [Fundicoccus sp. Sow4_F4]|uniref:hypothetical protein n=1 Tax=Fundicoccus sp. Sow4_F4 TaxID=3438783 RepID=UPI003F8F45F1